MQSEAKLGWQERNWWSKDLWKSSPPLNQWGHWEKLSKSIFSELHKLTKAYSNLGSIYSPKMTESQYEEHALWHFNLPHSHSPSPAFSHPTSSDVALKTMSLQSQGKSSRLPVTRVDRTGQELCQSLLTGKLSLFDLMFPWKILLPRLSLFELRARSVNTAYHEEAFVRRNQRQLLFKIMATWIGG